MKRKLFAIIMLMIGLGIANADCVCKCVNGNVEAICENAFELKPLCSPMICPLPTPSIAPLELPSLPPIGTTQCRQEQIYNEWTGSYEWVEICR